MTRTAFLMTTLVSLLVVTLLYVTPASARDFDDYPPRWAFNQDEAHSFDLSLVGHVSHLFGGGIIFGIPIAPKGFSSKINDAFYFEIEGGFGAQSKSRWAGAGYVLAGVRYQLFLFDWFAPYIVGRGGVWHPFGEKWPRPFGYGALGAMFMPNKHIAFRIEGGYGGRIGVTFLF